MATRTRRSNTTASSGYSVSANELGVSGVEVYDGQIKNEDTQHELKGARGLKKIRNMAENDDVAWTAYHTFLYLIKSTNWSISPASDSPADVENAEFMEEVINDMSNSFKAFVGNAATMIRDGFSTFEIIFKQRKGINLKDFRQSSSYTDGLWGIQKLALRDQMTIKKGKWINLESGYWTGVEQEAPDGSIYTIPRGKLLNFTTTDDSDSNPEGRSMLRGMYRASNDRRKLENNENIGHSRSTAGTLNIKVPPEIMAASASDDEKAMLKEVKKIATQYHHDEQGSLISPAIYDDEGNLLYQVEVLNGGTGGNDISKPILRKIINQAMTMYIDWLYLGHEGSSGTRSLSSDRLSLMIMVIEALLDSIKHVLDYELMAKMMLINNRDVSGGLPSFKYTPLQKADVQMVSEVIKNLSISGQTFDDLATANAIRKELNLPLITQAELDNGGIEEDM